MANRYWVGGTAAWDGTAGTKWSLTSGGPGGEAVPTSADDVFFSSASTGTCTISAGNTGAKSINCTGFTGTIDGTAAITVSGSVTLVSGMTYTYTGTLTINAASTLTSGGKTHGSVTFNAASSTLTLGDACTLGTTNTFTLTQGTLNLNGNTLSTGIFSSSGSSTRSITFGSANIALTSTTAATTILNMGTASNFTWTGTGAFTRNMAATATIIVGTTAGGSFTTSVNLTVNAGSSTLTLNGWYRILNFTGSTCSVSGTLVRTNGAVTLASGGTYTSIVTFQPETSGTFTSNGRSIASLNIFPSGGSNTLTLGSALTCTGNITLNAGTLALANFNLATPTFNSSNSNTRAISFGSGNIALTSTTAGASVLSMSTATNFTWTGTGGFTRNMAAIASVVFGFTGGSTTNAPNLTVNAGASALTIAQLSWFKNVNFTGSTCSVTGNNPVYVAGNLTLASGGTYTSFNPSFPASGTLTSAGKSLGVTSVNGSGITVTLADAANCTDLLVSQGTLDLAGFTFTATTTARTASSNAKNLTFNGGTLVCSAATTTAWDNAGPTNFTTTAGTGTGTISMTAATAKTFVGGGSTYNCTLNQGGAGALTISGSNTFNNITNSTQPATVTFTAGTTQTVSAFGLSGTAGNLITIDSTSAGSQATLSKASGTVTVNYLSIKDSNATGGAVWDAYTGLGNVDAGNNAGWLFPTTGSFLMFLS